MTQVHPYEVTPDAQDDWHRNIVSLRKSVSLLERFVEDDAELQIVLEHEAATKLTRAPAPIISRPFEDAEVYDPIAAAIQWPFEHPGRSRFSDGSFGVWYGAESLETSIHETAYHFKINTLASAAAYEAGGLIYQERRVHLVHCGALLIDLREQCAMEPRLLDKLDYGHCQSLGIELHHASQPGIITRSARHDEGIIVAVFTQNALSHPRDVCYLTYALDAGTQTVSVERQPGKTEWVING